MSKGPNAFRTISEAADEVGVPQHVLRFWETRFSFIRPMKRAGGRRFYRPQDVAVLKGVRALLHDRGFKIEGVQRLYREQGLKHLLGAAGQETDGLDLEADDTIEASSGTSVGRGISDEGRRRLRAALQALEQAKGRLDAVLHR